MTKQQYEQLRYDIISSYRNKVIDSRQTVAALKQAEETYKKERSKK